ncbi:MAG: periplasmic heavy metal sensor [Desulfobacterales bacterium]|nr:MAG: periplasmic heavy metal sensor [Desulfobacterales bacterium]
MRLKNSGKVILATAIVAIVGFAATSFAGWGRGGGGFCGGPGAGWGPGPRGYGDQGYSSDLSDEEIAKLNEERSAFLQDTRELRDTLYQKELELRSELAKQDPDPEKAKGLQKEISDLEGQLDQKRLEHRLQMRKTYPRFAGRGMGYGGRGMGRGFGPGACWE